MDKENSKQARLKQKMIMMQIRSKRHYAIQRKWILSFYRPMNYILYIISLNELCPGNSPSPDCAFNLSSSINHNFSQQEVNTSFKRRFNDTSLSLPITNFSQSFGYIISAISLHFGSIFHEIS